jgi:hypothetical protein
MHQMRERTRRAIARLPAGLLSLEPAPEPYVVKTSPALSAHEAEVRRQIAAANLRR